MKQFINVGFDPLMFTIQQMYKRGEISTEQFCKCKARYNKVPEERKGNVVIKYE